jgi:hypothetical protein
MNTNRKNARWAGVFYIAATVASSLTVMIMSPILDAPDYLVHVAGNEFQVMMAALLMLIDVVAVVGIGIVLYPILKKHIEALALGYATARAIEGVLFTVYVVGILTLLTLSQEFVKAGAPDASHFQTGGTLLLAASDWAFSLGLRLAFVVSALLLNFSLYQTRLIPRWLSGWGFVGAILVFALLLFEFFGITPPEISDYLIAVQEMVFAVWLIVKGFNPSAVASEPAK